MSVLVWKLIPNDAGSKLEPAALPHPAETLDESSRLLPGGAYTTFRTYEGAKALCLSNHFRRLVWLLSDESGGIGWRAAELLGEALYYCRALFPEYVPILISLLDMEPEDAPRFQSSVLRAIGRVAQADASAMQAARPLLLPLLHSPDPQVADLASQCLQLLDQNPSGRE